MKTLLNISLLTLLAVSTAVSQPLISETGSISSSVRLRVIIPMQAKIVASGNVAPVAITAADVRRGWKDVPSASVVTVWSNSPNGFVLQSRLATVRTLDGRQEGDMIVLARTRDSAEMIPLADEYQDFYRGDKAVNNVTDLSIDFKVLINPGTRPGTYQLAPEFLVSCL